MKFSALLAAAAACAALSAGIGAMSLPAAAGPLSGSLAKPAEASLALVLVHDDWDDDDWDRRRHRRHYYRGHHVDAPFTHVETGNRGRVVVDAPFASVRVGRRGTWVRAPFVNLFVPR